MLHIVNYTKIKNNNYYNSRLFLSRLRCFPFPNFSSRRYMGLNAAPTKREKDSKPSCIGLAFVPGS